MENESPLLEAEIREQEICRRNKNCGRRAFAAGLRYIGYKPPFDIPDQIGITGRLMDQAKRFGLIVPPPGSVFIADNDPVLMVWEDHGHPAHAAFMSDPHIRNEPGRVVHIVIHGYEEAARRFREKEYRDRVF
jgi:hypothetical protein